MIGLINPSVSSQVPGDKGWIGPWKRLVSGPPGPIRTAYRLPFLRLRDFAARFASLLPRMLFASDRRRSISAVSMCTGHVYPSRQSLHFSLGGG